MQPTVVCTQPCQRTFLPHKLPRTIFTEMWSSSQVLHLTTSTWTYELFRLSCLEVNGLCELLQLRGFLVLRSHADGIVHWGSISIIFTNYFSSTSSLSSSSSSLSCIFHGVGPLVDPLRLPLKIISKDYQTVLAAAVVALPIPYQTC